MIVGADDPIHLTYCTNIHPGESLGEVLDNVKNHVLPVKARVCPDRPFGLGLWLSRAAVEQFKKERRDAFVQTLHDNDLYVFTLNGFPYGRFHQTQVKEKVYLPDWTDEDRMAYTDLLALALVGLIPRESAIEGSISTLPGGFSGNIRTEQDVEAMTARLIHAAAFLYLIEQDFGRRISLALEPEPFCHLSTIEQTIDFFKERLFDSRATAQLADMAGIDQSRAESVLHEKLGVCFDACHFAVQFADPVESIRALQKAGIRIVKVQLSSGLVAPEVTADSIEALSAFADNVYLHQVFEQTEGRINAYLDLPQAIESFRPDGRPRQWRIHFHTPLYQSRFGSFSGTHPFLEELIPLLVKERITDHLEVETYTWDVLPESFRALGLTEAIARELEWVRKRIADES